MYFVDDAHENQNKKSERERMETKICDKKKCRQTGRQVNLDLNNDDDNGGGG